MSELKPGDRVPKPAVARSSQYRNEQRKRVDDRPRIISAAAVENELPFTGCICCGAILGDPPLKHRAGCLYLAFTRAQQMADHYQDRSEELESAIRDIRGIAHSVAKRRSMRR